jgi:hypothetical protein
MKANIGVRALIQAEFGARAPDGSPMKAKIRARAPITAIVGARAQIWATLFDPQWKPKSEWEALIKARFGARIIIEATLLTKTGAWAPINATVKAIAPIKATPLDTQRKQILEWEHQLKPDLEQELVMDPK